jgi:hypothetical protein
MSNSIGHGQFVDKSDAHFLNPATRTLTTNQEEIGESKEWRLSAVR